MTTEVNFATAPKFKPTAICNELHNPLGRGDGTQQIGAPGGLLKFLFMSFQKMECEKVTWMEMFGVYNVAPVCHCEEKTQPKANVLIYQFIMIRFSTMYLKYGLSPK